MITQTSVTSPSVPNDGISGHLCLSGTAKTNHVRGPETECVLNHCTHMNGSNALRPDSTSCDSSFTFNLCSRVPPAVAADTAPTVHLDVGNLTCSPSVKFNSVLNRCTHRNDSHDAMPEPASYVSRFEFPFNSNVVSDLASDNDQVFAPGAKMCKLTDSLPRDFYYYSNTQNNSDGSITYDPPVWSADSSPAWEAIAESNSSDLAAGLDQLYKLQQLVKSVNACALPGVSIVYDKFIPLMKHAVATGYVKQSDAEFVFNGLTHGFRGGIQKHLLKGRQFVGKNYKSAVDARPRITKAIMKRVAAKKTLPLGAFNRASVAVLRSTFEEFLKFSMSGVAKKLNGVVLDEIRPASDHTKSGLNEATILGILKHSVKSYEEIEWFLKQGYFMAVSDVEGAFPLLPIAPDLWVFFLLSCFASEHARCETLFVHLTGDFGTSGWPGVFKIFFTDVLVNMARSALVLALPMVIHVDDTALIGPVREEVDSEMASFQNWSRDLGVEFKIIKDRAAAQDQLMIGFHWNSITRNRTLEESKFIHYRDVCFKFASCNVLTLKEAQSAQGKMLRAVMTLPPGAACLLVNVFAFTHGLKFGWQRRRTTKSLRNDFLEIYELMGMNLGRGYFSHDQFELAPNGQTDASKSRQFTGGGWVCADGNYSFFEYGTSAARKPIDALEGDTLVDYVHCNMHKWYQCMVPVDIDNSSFLGAVNKGWSHADRLQCLVKEIFYLQLEGEFILQLSWICSRANELADHLSRNREAEFLKAAIGSGLFINGSLPRRCDMCGFVKGLGRRVSANYAGDGQSHIFFIFCCTGCLWLDILILAYFSRWLARLWAVPRRQSLIFVRFIPNITVGRIKLNRSGAALRLRGGGGERGDAAQISSVPASWCCIHADLPVDVSDRIDNLLDTRLKTGSMRVVNTASKRWNELCELRGWDPVLLRDSPTRGSRLAEFVMQMVDDDSIQYSTISRYVWGLCHWQKLMRQPDPRRGVWNWQEFMKAVKVVTWVANEPRKIVPLEWIETILFHFHAKAVAGTITRMNAQFCLLLVVMFFTFSRAECPCPRHSSGPQSFDPKQHWQVNDFQLRAIEGVACLGVRFKSIKPDPRMERPEARGTGEQPHLSDLGDWVFIGRIDDTAKQHYDVIFWYSTLLKLWGKPRPKDAPFFMNSSDSNAYIYSQSLTDFKNIFAELIGGDATDYAGYGWHGVRVAGYNASVDSLNGEELTVAHGGWKSTAHARYRRFTMSKVLQIPANMVEGAVVTRTTVRSIKGKSVVRGKAVCSDSSNDDGEDADAEDSGSDFDNLLLTYEKSMLPPNYVKEVRNHSGLSRPYSVILAPDGHACDSRPAAWAYFRRPEIISSDTAPLVSDTFQIPPTYRPYDWPVD